jgi:uncharacterized protein
MVEKLIRDPVHDVIAFRLDQRGEALLFKLLNAREFQRLRRIRQLGLATMAYPGADHSRYSHSLGVMETARKILHRLGEQVKIDAEQRTACLAAALLHDLGHGPFSHVFERVSGVHHEDLTRRIILDDDSEVHQILRGYDRAMPGWVESLIHCRTQRTWFHDVLCSQLDADRFDYLLRDNLMTGSRYGHFDLRWLVQHLTVDDATDRLAVTHKGVSAIEAYLQGRYHMYRNVYFHKVVRSAEGMVKLALQRARRLAVQERLAWPTPDEAVHKALLGRQLSMREFVDLDDVSVMHCFKVWMNGEDVVLAQLCRGLLYRELFKSTELTRLGDASRLAEIRETVADAIDAAGGESAYAVFYDEPSDTPYEMDQADSAVGATEILVRDASGKLTDFAEISPVSRSLAQQLMFRRLHFAAEYRELVKSIVG